MTETNNDVAILRDALMYIAGTLTPSQRHLLVGSLVQADHGNAPVLVDGNQRTIEALQGGVRPLVEQTGPRRYLSPLGLYVARYINETSGLQVAGEKGNRNVDDL